MKKPSRRSQKREMILVWLCGIARQGGLSASGNYIKLYFESWGMLSADAYTNVTFFILTLEQYRYRHLDRRGRFNDKTVFSDRASVVAPVNTFHNHYLRVRVFAIF